MDEKQGVAQWVMDELTERFKSARAYDPLLSGAKEGAAYLHDELSAEARAILAELDAEVENSMDSEGVAHPIMSEASTEATAVRRAFQRLGLDIEGTDQHR